MCPPPPTDDPVPEEDDAEFLYGPDANHWHLTVGVRDLSDLTDEAELQLVSIMWRPEGWLVSGRFLSSEFVYEAGEEVLVALGAVPVRVIVHVEGRRLARYVEKRVDARRVVVIDFERMQMEELDDAPALALSHACSRR